MSTYSSIYYHLVWTTKHREPWLAESVESRVHKYLNVAAKQHKALTIACGGMADHVHMLLMINPDSHLSNMVKDLKVSSTNMIRREIDGLQNFSWQSGYGAFSVSKSNTSMVEQYVRNQKKHHEKLSLQDEWIGLLERHGIQYNEKYLFE